MRVLAVGAHPDDLEMLCGGTLARYVREGHQVTMCHVALGDRGSFVHTSEEIARTRLAEAKEAATVVGAETTNSSGGGSPGLSGGVIGAGVPNEASIPRPYPFTSVASSIGPLEVLLARSGLRIRSSPTAAEH